MRFRNSEESGVADRNDVSEGEFASVGPGKGRLRGSRSHP